MSNRNLFIYVTALFVSLLTFFILAGYFAESHFSDTINFSASSEQQEIQTNDQTIKATNKSNL